MQWTYRFVATTIFAASVLSATSNAQRVKVDTHGNSGLKTPHTFSWKSQPAATSWDTDVLREAVTSSLEARGWKLVESGGDVVVSAELDIKTKLHTSTSDYQLTGTAGSGDFDFPTTTVSQEGRTPRQVVQNPNVPHTNEWQTVGNWVRTVALNASITDAKTGASLWDAKSTWSAASNHSTPPPVDDAKVINVANRMFRTSH